MTGVVVLCRILCSGDRGAVDAGIRSLLLSCTAYRGTSGELPLPEDSARPLPLENPGVRLWSLRTTRFPVPRASRFPARPRPSGILGRRCSLWSRLSLRHALVGSRVAAPAAGVPPPRAHGGGGPASLFSLAWAERTGKPLPFFLDALSCHQTSSLDFFLWRFSSSKMLPREICR